ncbi:RES domain-containing protein [Chryseobacterium gambrini]|uniref:RES domain-containing protein n=1 Tax=Chryseobacterium gambrini TaxID=373672 RepID=A0ABN7CDU8_9FLAO|nr:RES domain-containing protein [Chryseobacterium gambrini]
MEYICYECVGEEYLRHEILANGNVNECSFCGEDENHCFTLKEIIEKVEFVILENYERTAQDPDFWEEFMSRETGWDRDGQIVYDILINDFDFNPEAAAEISEYLQKKHYDHSAAEMYEESEFGQDTHYKIKSVSSQGWISQWEEFKRIIKYESRFFNKNISNTLVNIFHEIELITTIDGVSVVTTIGPNSEIKSLFRARTFYSTDKILETLTNPSKFLGPPPSTNATTGRMNAKGISVFYGSTNKDVAIAEVRPPVGSNVITAQFDLLQPVKLLNFELLNEVIDSLSVFHPDYKSRMEKIAFLTHFSTLITYPVMPGDEELEYLPTQAIADFLTERYDGLIFPSVQVNFSDKNNVVLFNKSSRVEEFKPKKGNHFSSHHSIGDPDDPYEEFYIFEGKNKSEVTEDSKIVTDSRDCTLRLNVESITVNKITAVDYIKTETTVSHMFLQDLGDTTDSTGSEFSDFSFIM